MSNRGLPYPSNTPSLKTGKIFLEANGSDSYFLVKVMQLLNLDKFSTSIRMDGISDVPVELWIAVVQCWFWNGNVLSNFTSIMSIETLNLYNEVHCVIELGLGIASKQMIFIDIDFSQFWSLYIAFLWRGHNPNLGLIYRTVKIVT